MAVTITRTTQTEDRTTGEVVTSVTEFDGTAVRVQGRANEYAETGLKEIEAPTLIWFGVEYDVTPTPQPGDTIVWRDVVHTIGAVYPLSPDGVTISCRLIIHR